MIKIKYLLSLNRYSRNGKKNSEAKGIVIHHGENKNFGAVETRNYFENLKTGKNAIYYSTHYIVGYEGEVIYCVPEEEIAYHRGNCDESSGHISITYCCNEENLEPGLKTLISLRALIRDIVVRYNFDVEKDLLRHFDVSGKKCPSFYASNDCKWKLLKQDIKKEIKIARQFSENVENISKELSRRFSIDEGYLAKILLEQAEVDILTLFKIVTKSI